MFSKGILVSVSAITLTGSVFAAVSFQSAQSLSAGTGAQDASSIASGDINGDGRIDLVVANRGGSANVRDGSVVVLLGNGAGGFEAAKAVHTGSLDRPIALAVADLDGDNDLDIAVVTLGGDGVVFFFNDGAGDFPDTDSQGVGNSPEAIAVGDFNGDNRPDLIVPSREDDAVTVLLNSGTTPPQFPSAEGGATDLVVPAQRTEPQGVAVGDFDRNGTLDAAVALLRQDQVAILLGNGDGTFDPDFARVDVGTTASRDADPRAVVAADFDGDNDIDLAVANSAGDSVTILRNNGSGVFSNGGDFPAGNDPRGLIALDLDGDGRIDLATANFEGDDVTVLLGKGDGTFDAPQSFKVGSGPFALAAGNFDGKSPLDLATANQEADNVSVLLGGTSSPDVDLNPLDDLAIPDCAAINCGPMALTPLCLSVLGVAALKRRGRASFRGRERR